MRRIGIVLALLWCPLAACADSEGWPERLRSRVEALDRESPGELGVFVKRLDGSGETGHQATKSWYLSSTIKVPVAIVVLQKVEAGEISLSQPLVLKASDPVDGAGELQSVPPGRSFSVADLLERMLVQSDSTAADMLIRLAGEDDLNAFLKSNGFGPATTLFQVRLDAYGELHPDARRLSNADFLEIKRAGGPEARRRALAEKLGVGESELRAPDLPEAFERYYRRGLNSAPLTAFGRLLERLARGELLSPENTERVLRHMEAITTGERRLKAGLPAGARFAQKTGTQLGRICNVGVVNRGAPGALVVAACVERFTSEDEAERLLLRVARALVESGAL